jgi:cobalamin biosynthesis Mg chelatase CobN
MTVEEQNPTQTPTQASQTQPNPVTPPKEEKKVYTYITKAGKVRKFKTKEGLERFIERTKNFGKVGALGGRPAKNKSEPVQGSEASSSSSPAPIQLTNEEAEKKETERKKKEELEKKKKLSDAQFQKSVMVIAIIIVSLVLVMIFFLKVKPKLGGESNDNRTATA